MKELYLIQALRGGGKEDLVELVNPVCAGVHAQGWPVHQGLHRGLALEGSQQGRVVVT